MEGFLQKGVQCFGVRFWRRKWATLTTRGFFLYSANRSILEEFHPFNCLEMVSNSDSGTDFTLFLAHRRLRLRAPSHAAKLDWISALRTTKYSQEIERTAPLSRRCDGDARRSALRAQRVPIDSDGRVAAAIAAQTVRLAALQKQVNVLERSVLKLSWLVAGQQAALAPPPIADRLSSSCESLDSVRQSEFSSAREAVDSESDSPKSSATTGARRSDGDEQPLIDALELSVELESPRAPTRAQRLVESLRVFRRFPLASDTPPTRVSLPTQRKPSPQPSVIGLLKQCIGRDWASISMPCSVCEPLSQTQRSLEFLAHFDVLRRAATNGDEFERAAAAFCPFYFALGDAAARDRRPFSALLGETFEYCGDGVRALCEAISCKPPTIAYHVESAEVVIDALYRQNVSFSLVSGVDIDIWSQIRVLIRATGEEFRVDVPKPVLAKLLRGSLALSFRKGYRAQNRRTSAAAELRFDGEATRDKPVRGSLLDGGGVERATLDGRFAGPLFLVAKDGARRLLGSSLESTAESATQYGLGNFAIGLNHLTPELLAALPPTDARLRPDLRAYEHGDVALADEESRRLLARQRAWLQALKGCPPKPHWFDFDETAYPQYAFNGKYWLCRETGEWPEELPNLFGEN